MSWLNSDESSEEDEYGFSDFDNDESVEALEPVQLPDNSAKESVANWGAGVLPETEPEAIKGGSFLPTLSLSKDEAGNNTEGSNEKSTLCFFVSNTRKRQQKRYNRCRRHHK